MLNEDGIPARSDATQAMNVFGGLPFEPGHKIFVAASQARQALQILVTLPPLQVRSRTCTSCRELSIVRGPLPLVTDRRLVAQ